MIVSSSKILQRIYEKQLFTSHEILDNDMESLLREHKNSLLPNEQTISFTCGSLKSIEFLQKNLHEITNFAEIATIDHIKMTSCLLSRLSQQNLQHINELIKDDHLDHEILPPVLKIHQSVMDYLPHLAAAKAAETEATTEDTKILSQQTERRPNQFVEGIPSPEGMTLTVQFLRSNDLENHSEMLLSEIFTAWRTQSTSDSHESHRRLTKTQRGNGRWAKLMKQALSSHTAARALSSQTAAANNRDHDDHDKLDFFHNNNDNDRHNAECLMPQVSFFEYERWAARVVDLSGWSSSSSRHPQQEHSLFCFLSLIETMAQHSQVVSISLLGRPVLLNYDARGSLQSGSARTPFTDAGILGAGEVVGVADSGLDDYSCYFWDNSNSYGSKGTTRSNYLGPTVERNRRKVIQYVAYADGSDTEAGHGSHVVGTIIGNSIFDDFVGGNGIAPAAKVAFYDIMASNSPYLSIPDTFSYLYPTLYNAGARVLSNSWGSYSSESKSILSFLLLQLTPLASVVAQYSEREYDVDNFLSSHPVRSPSSSFASPHSPPLLSFLRIP
jgi:hypothetical protein